MAADRAFVFRDKWNAALAFERFVEDAEQNVGLWEGVYRTASIPDWAREELRELGTDLRIMILAEDWCGDAANSVPVIAKLGAVVENVDVRILKRFMGHDMCLHQNRSK